MKLLVQRDIEISIPFNIYGESDDVELKSDVDEHLSSVLRPKAIHYKTRWTEKGLDLTILAQKITLDEHSVEEFLDVFYDANIYLELTHISGVKFELGYSG